MDQAPSQQRLVLRVVANSSLVDYESQSLAYAVPTLEEP